MDFQWGDSLPAHSTPHSTTAASEQLEHTPLPPIWDNSDMFGVNGEQELEALEGKLNQVQVSGITLRSDSESILT